VHAWMEYRLLQPTIVECLAPSFRQRSKPFSI
jgi:hypothetical protein